MSERLGVYVVDNLRFVNKYDALLFATKTNHTVTWEFNDPVFSSFDWSVPIKETLEDLYKQRAQQIRDSYDYVSVFFSGGVDSANILCSFINNNIKIDEIVMFRPRGYTHNYANHTSEHNLYSEIELAAIPFINKYVDVNKVNIKILYLEDAFEKLLNNTVLLSQFYKLNYLDPTQFAKTAIAVTDAEWNNLYDSGKKVAHVIGADKPFVTRTYDKDNDRTISVAGFSDDAVDFVFESDQQTDIAKKLKSQQNFEFFYWTPDLPRLPIKQAQSINALKQDFPAASVVNACLYSDQVLQINGLFCATKPNWDVNGPSQQWIHNANTTKSKEIYADILALARGEIKETFLLHDKNIKTLRPRYGCYTTFQSKKYLL